MIARYPGNWPNDMTKMKCHNPPSTLEDHSYDLFVPVLGSANQLNYRNQYCTKCNNVFKYEFMSLNFKDDAIPPTYYTEELKKFIAKNHRKFLGVKPIHGQAMRFCYYPTDVINTCPKTISGARDACVNGVGGLVEGGGRVFENRKCALCNGATTVVRLGDVKWAKAVPFLLQ